MFGAATARGDALTMRLAMIYALLDRDDAIRLENLEAAYAVWKYCEASAGFIFGDASGDPTADRILEALRASPEGMTRRDVRDLFQRHKGKAEIDRAIDALAARGMVRREKLKTAGAPVQMLFPVSDSDTSDTSDTRGKR